MPFVVQLTPPGKPPEYLPEGFGFVAHAHVTEIEKAARFRSADQAGRVLQGYAFPPAFWEMEIHHRRAMEQKFKTWKLEVIEVAA